MSLICNRSKKNFILPYLTEQVQLWLFYKHLCHSFYSVCQSSFSSQSSKQHNFQTVKSRVGTGYFQTMFTTPFVSHVICHMSPVICHVSPVFFLLLFDKVVELVGGVSVITGPTPSTFFFQIYPVFLQRLFKLFVHKCVVASTDKCYQHRLRRLAGRSCWCFR